MGSGPMVLETTEAWAIQCIDGLLLLELDYYKFVESRRNVQHATLISMYDVYK